MRLRNIPEAKEIVARSAFVVKNPETHRGHWKEDPSRPLYVEIGTGKGRFLIETALLHPEADYIGVERYESVLFRACERMEGIPYHTPRDQMENAGQTGALPVPANVRFLSTDARELPAVFAEGEVDGLFLNFSDPWPKARHAKRRLTSSEFLSTYEKYLRDGGLLAFKTDNTGLFEFSVEEVRAAPHWQLLSVTRDLHHDPEMCAGNVMTEYERKFSALGHPICRLEAVYRRDVAG